MAPGTPTGPVVCSTRLGWEPGAGEEVRMEDKRSEPDRADEEREMEREEGLGEGPEGWDDLEETADEARS